MYSTIPDAIKMVVGNKVDQTQGRQVTKDQGKSFARQHGMLFLETSAKVKATHKSLFSLLSSLSLLVFIISIPNPSCVLVP